MRESEWDTRGHEVDHGDVPMQATRLVRLPVYRMYIPSYLGSSKITYL